MANEYSRNLKMKQALQQRSSAKNLNSKMQSSLPAAMRPGNVGAINRVIWPFWFTSSMVEIGANSSAQGFTTITQEAAFVMMAYTKAVYKRTGAPGSYAYTFVDSLNEEAVGQSDDLSFTIRDSSSSRTFHNKPLQINQVGGGEFPSVLPTPILFLPNSNIETTFQNNSSDVYVPFITFFGYRVRIDDAQNILSTVTG